MLTPKDGIKLANTENIVLNVETAANFLDGRRLVTGPEAKSLQKLTPLDTTLDILYITYRQATSENVLQVADEFGRHTDPATDNTAREENDWTPENAIVISLKVHDFNTDSWKQGMLLISNSKSGYVKQIYASATDLLSAKRYAKGILHQNTDVGIYVDVDVQRRFKLATKSTINIELTPDDVQIVVDRLNEQIRDLNTDLTSLTYQPPEAVMQQCSRLQEKTEKIRQNIILVKSKIESEESETKTKIATLEQKLEFARDSRDQLADEIEQQINKIQCKNIDYQNQIQTLNNKIKISKEDDNSKQQVEAMESQITDLRESHQTDTFESLANMDAMKLELNNIITENTVTRDRWFDAESKLLDIKKQSEVVKAGSDLCKSEAEYLPLLMKPSQKINKSPQPSKYVYLSESSDDEDYTETISSPIATLAQVGDEPTSTRVSIPQKYGMTRWNSTNSTIIQHLTALKIGMDQAREQKVPDPQIQNLVLLTLPAEYQYVADFITADDRTTTQKFLAKIVELIDGSKQEQLSSFLRQQRKHREHILSYFSRLKNLYMHSSNSDDIENDKFGVRLIYQKVIEGMEKTQAIELQRSAENKITTGELTFSELLQHVAQAARRMATPGNPTPLTQPEL